MDDVMRVILAPYGDTRVAEAVAAYREDYSKSGLFKSIAYAGVADALSSLRQADTRLYVATSKRTTFARRILEHLGFEKYFSGIYGSEPGGALDHKSELIGYILRHASVRADRCIMVGDRRYDVLGAHANGMPAIGVLWGYGSQHELISAGADYLISSPSELSGRAPVLSPRSSGSTIGGEL